MSLDDTLSYLVVPRDGQDGRNGTDGKDGAPGPRGDQGPKGLKGDTGPKGDPGRDGPIGPKGSKGEPGEDGVGISSVSIKDGNLIVSYDDGTEQNAGRVVGPTGESRTVFVGGVGETGDGSVGPKGDTGDTGPQGLKGDTGATGPAGDTGPMGPTGPAGDTGPQGIAGPTGPSGSADVNVVEIDAGEEFVDEASFVIPDSDVTPFSILVAGILLASPSDGRSVDEIYLEQMDVVTRQGTGSFQADLLSKEGQFHGKFLLGYLVINP